ncbi:hypothetical protein [Neptuniibacter sp. QD37_11]|uniref:hypothetical protein n=1 Tax=Neptuniibacter sp. QD37_11 TaxID=3398209 RepID=UPI0039F5C16F
MNESLSPQPFTVYPFADLPCWQGETAQICQSFTAYVLQGYIGMATAATFFDRAIQYGELNIGYIHLSEGASGERFEFFILVDQNGAPDAMAMRVFNREGKLEEDSLGYIQYVMKPYPQRRTIASLQIMPMIEVPNQTRCHCGSEDH